MFLESKPGRTCCRGGEGSSHLQGCPAPRGLTFPLRCAPSSPPLTLNLREKQEHGISEGREEAEAPSRGGIVPENGLSGAGGCVCDRAAPLRGGRAPAPPRSPPAPSGSPRAPRPLGSPTCPRGEAAPSAPAAALGAPLMAAAASRRARDPGPPSPWQRPVFPPPPRARPARTWRRAPGSMRRRPAAAPRGRDWPAPRHPALPLARGGRGGTPAGRLGGKALAREFTRVLAMLRRYKRRPAHAPCSSCLCAAAALGLWRGGPGPCGLAAGRSRTAVASARGGAVGLFHLRALPASGPGCLPLCSVRVSVPVR